MIGVYAAKIARIWSDTTIVNIEVTKIRSGHLRFATADGNCGVHVEFRAS